MAAVSSVVSSPVFQIGSFSQDHFQTDLDFIHKTVLDNHPGVCDPLNPDFVSDVARNYEWAKKELGSVYSDEEKAQVLRTFARSFQDAHVGIRHDAMQPSFSAPMEKRSFGIQSLADGSLWISIPTFVPSEAQREQLREIAAQLPQFRKKNIIFDLRGNGGGNSALANEQLDALFGAEYAKARRDELSRNVFIEWRATEGNLRHIQEVLIPLVRSQFDLDHPAFAYFEDVCKGIKTALSCGEKYYTPKSPKESAESLPEKGGVSLFEGKCFAIVDRGCGSSCLNFLDGLKAMQPDAIFVGETTGADSNYMEVREVALPSGKGIFRFPIKVYRNRPRGHNVPHVPDVAYPGNLQDTSALQSFVLEITKK